MKCPKCHFENPDDTLYCGKCGAKLLSPGQIPASPTETFQAPKKELTTGSTFAARYQIIEEVGKGGMGKVYKVFDKEIEEKVALKLLKPEIASDEEMIQRFRNEIRVARKIVHKNVCRMYDLGQAEGTYFITMEFVEGEDLKSLIRRIGQLPIGKSLSIARQVCEGLAEAHKLRIVHRDLKPHNIMVDKEGNARIMDFGIARSLKAKGITGAEVMIGTPEYMSPEQVEGKGVDERSDIYALGVILYEMVTGKVPFEGDTALSVALKHKTEAPKDPREFNAQIPEDLSSLILRCLEKDKERRYPNAEEILSGLAKTDKELTTTRVFPGRRAKQTVPEKKFGPLTISAVLLAVIALAIAGYFFLGRAKKPEKPESSTVAATKWKNSIAVLPFVDLSPRKDQEYFCEGMAEDIRTKLSRLDPQIKVISRFSVVPYKNSQKSLKEIAKELDVATILEGSIQKEDQRIRVNAQLINTNDGSHLWANTYDKELESLFEVQDELSLAIAEALKIKLTPEKIEALKEGRTKNIEAYEYYQKGLNFINSRYLYTQQEKDFESAIEMFNKAIEFDPKYALAYVGLAWAYQNHYTVTRRTEDLDRVLENCEKAYELDPNLAESNAGRGWVYQEKNDFDKAYQSYKKALEINPNIHKVNHVIGLFFQTVGLYYQATKFYTKAAELDPFYVYSQANMARCLRGIGEFEKAEARYKKALELAPQNKTQLADSAYLFIMMKKYDEAEEVLGRVEKMDPNYSLSGAKALLFAAKGEKEKALALGQLTATAYAALGLKDEAIKYIEDAIKKDADTSVYRYLELIHNPFFDSLRDDPRFKEIVRKQKKIYEERLKKYGDL